MTVEVQPAQTEAKRKQKNNRKADKREPKTHKRISLWDERANKSTVRPRIVGNQKR
jgi:hypothetical protein